MIALLEAGVKSDNLSYCFDFLVAQGKVPGDVPLLVDFGKSCQDQNRQKVFLEHLKEKNYSLQTLNQLIQLAKANL